jgi:hypothetical protein
MNAMIRTSALGLVLVWTGLASAQSTTIEEVEAKTMSQAGGGAATAKGEAKMGQDRTSTAKGEAKMGQDRTSTAKGEAKMGQNKDASVKGEGSGVRQALRTRDRLRTHQAEKTADGSQRRMGQGEAGTGENCKGDAAEHRQERRGGGESSGSGASGKGSGSGMKSGSGSGRGAAN